MVLNVGCALGSAVELSRALMPGPTPETDFIGAQDVLGIGNFKSSPDDSNVQSVLGTTDFRRKFSKHRNGSITSHRR